MLEHPSLQASCSAVPPPWVAQFQTIDVLPSVGSITTRKHMTESKRLALGCDHAHDRSFYFGLFFLENFGFFLGQKLII